MNNIFFKHKGIAYTIKYVDNQMKIYKKVENNYVELNSKEYAMINSFLNKNYGYIYNSELLMSLVERNYNIVEKKYIYNLL